MKAAMQNLLSLPLFKGLASDELDTILGKVNALVKHFEKSDYIYLAGACACTTCARPISSPSRVTKLFSAMFWLLKGATR